MKRKVNKHYAFISIIVFNNKKIVNELLDSGFIEKIEELANISIKKVVLRKTKFRRNNREIIYVIPGVYVKAKEDINSIIHREIRNHRYGAEAELLYHVRENVMPLNKILSGGTKWKNTVDREMFQ